MHCPETGFDHFEEISYLLKKREDIDMNQFLKVMDDKSYSMPNNGENTNLAKFIAKARKLLGEVSIVYRVLKEILEKDK